MKKYIPILLAVLLICLSCNKTLSPRVSMETRHALVDCNGGTVTASFKCNTTWTATTETPGVTIDPAEGMCDAVITVVVPATNSEETTNILVNIKGRGTKTSSTGKFSITQTGREYIGFAPDTLNVPAAAGGVRGCLEANRDWQMIQIPAELTVTPTEGSAPADLKIDFPANTTGAARTFEVVAKLKNEGLTDTLRIIQAY